MFILADDPIEDSNIRRGSGYEVPSTFGEAASASFEQGMTFTPLHSLGRMWELGEATVDATIPKLDENEWKTSEFYREGLEYPVSGKMNRETARILAFRYDEEKQRAEAIESYNGGLVSRVGLFGIEMATQALDPINVGVSLIPIVGQGKWLKAAKEGATLGKRVGAAAKIGAVEGLVGNLAVEPIVYGAAEMEQSQTYGLPDAVANVLMGAPIGAGFGSLIKVGGELIGKIGGKVLVNPLDDLTPEARFKALQVAAAQLDNNKVVDVETIITADNANTGKTATRAEAITRLSNDVELPTLEGGIGVLDIYAKYVGDSDAFWQRLSKEDVLAAEKIAAHLKRGEIGEAIDAAARAYSQGNKEAYESLKKEIYDALAGEGESIDATILKEAYYKFGETELKTAEAGDTKFKYANREDILAELKEAKAELENTKRELANKVNEKKNKRKVVVDEKRVALAEKDLAEFDARPSPVATEPVTRTSPFANVKKVKPAERAPGPDIKEPKELFEDDITTADQEIPERSGGVTQEEVDLKTKFGGEEDLRTLDTDIEKSRATLDEALRSGTISDAEYRMVMSEIAAEDATAFITKGKLEGKLEGDVPILNRIVRCFIP